MKTNVKTRIEVIIKIIFLFILFSLPVLALAEQQIEPPPVDPVDTPIDGGLSVLLAAGAAYGVKRMRKGAKPLTPKEE